jgi:hypothetical protein
MLRQALGRFKSMVVALMGYACLAAAEAPPKALVLADFELIDTSPTKSETERVARCIRGNTDESWLRGVRRLVDKIESRKHYLR